MERPFRILSIDGGGIRGIIPAMVLADVERRTGRPISSLFDLIAGTSAGGIIALCITKPGEDGEPEYTAQEIAELYFERGGKIFSSSLLHQLSSVWGVLDEKYPATEVEKVFDDYLGSARLKDALTNVLVTAFEIQKRTPWFFPQHQRQAVRRVRLPDEEGRPRDVGGSDVLRAAAARGRGQGQGGRQALGARGRRRLREQPYDVRTRRRAHR